MRSLTTPPRYGRADTSKGNDMSKEPIRLMQHGEWTTAIYALGAKSEYSFRVETASGRSSLNPVTFTHTMMAAKMAAAEHIVEIKKARRIA
jgi:hypothetical protein